MHRNATAVYRTHSTADLVRRELIDLGVAARHVHVIPDRDDPVATDGYRDDSRAMDDLHDLHLPDNDLRTYQQSVRRGDHVVSVEIENEDLDRVLAVMRRPESETYDLDARAAEFDREAVIAHSNPGRRPDPDLLGARDTAYDDPYVRSYRRNRPNTIG